MFPEQEIITGERIQELAEVSIATADRLVFHASLSEAARQKACLIEQLPDGRIYMSPEDLDRLKRARSIFVYSDLLEIFFVIIAPNLDRPFVVLSHNGDIGVDPRFEQVIDNPLLLRWYAQNIEPGWRHPKLVSIPIGIANSQWLHGNLAPFSSLPAYRDKSVWLYVNINVTTNQTYRSEIVRTLSCNPVAVVEQGLSVDQYVRRVAQSRFVASPRGNGIDCHRTWETLYLGAVPVMARQDRVACLDGLPVLETEGWDDLPPERLREVWEMVTRSAWRLESLYLSYWRRRLEDEFRAVAAPAVPAAPTPAPVPAPELTKRDGLPMILVYIGPELPTYIGVALKQARLFSSGDIYIVVHAASRSQLSAEALDGIQVVALEELGLTPAHARFQEVSRLDRSFRNGFWTYTTERFFVVESLMRARGLESAVHIECDNLIYFDPSAYEPIFRAHYAGLAVPFDSDQRTIPGFVYIRSVAALSGLTAFILDALQELASGATNDMLLVADYRRHNPAEVAALPVITPDYPQPLVSQTGLVPADPGFFSSAFDGFRSVFDAAALGQYLGGIDPSITTAGDTRGFVNESAVYDPRLYSFEVGPDEQGRRCYYLRSAAGLWRINTLHIHSKDLTAFAS